MAAAAIIKQMMFEHRRSPFARNNMVFWWWWIVADVHHLTQFTYNEGRTPAKQINALVTAVLILPRCCVSHDTDWRKSYWTINRSPEAAGAAQKVAAPVTCEPIRSGLQDLKNELKKVSPLQSLSAHRIPNKDRRPRIV